MALDAFLRAAPVLPPPEAPRRLRPLCASARVPSLRKGIPQASLMILVLVWQPLLPCVHALFWVRALVSRRTYCTVQKRKKALSVLVRCVPDAFRCGMQKNCGREESENVALPAGNAWLHGHYGGARRMQYTTSTSSASPTHSVFVYLQFTAGVAQLVEPQIVTLVVAGSSPVTRPRYHERHGTRCRGVCRFPQR